jgi:glycosyltransferase involved in cell wall biosynthesis
MLSTWSLNQKRLRKILAMKLIWHRLICDTTIIHALNHAEESELRARFPATAINVIPNGIFAEEFDDLPAPGESTRLVPGICAGRRFILFLARLHYMKGPDLLLNAFARIADKVPDLDLVIAGPDFGMKQGLTAQITKAGLLTRVHMPGAVYGREKLALLHDAECLCQPSRHEGFSITMLEALACGLPVITTTNANFDEIGAAGAGIIAGADAESLSTAVLRLTTNPQSRIDQSERGRNLVMRCYTWPAIEQRLRNVYTRAVLEASGATL